MCGLISFLHKPTTGDIKVWDLISHENTAKHHNITPDNNAWREGHYLPDGTIEARVADTDRISAKECAERLRKTFPTFVSFLAWCAQQKIQPVTYLNLSPLTSAKGLVIPQGVTYLNLSALVKEELKERNK